MRRTAWFYGNGSGERGRVLARVLSEDLRRVRGGEEIPLDSDIITAAPPGRDISSLQSDGELTF
jgi:hypothetical protein